MPKERILEMRAMAREVPIAPHVTGHAVRLVMGTHPEDAMKGVVNAVMVETYAVLGLLITILLLMFAVASFGAQGLLRGYYRPLIRRNRRHRWMLWTWLRTVAILMDREREISRVPRPCARRDSTSNSRTVRPWARDDARAGAARSRPVLSVHRCAPSR